MKILFDHQTFENQSFGGISRYFYELINHFQNNEKINYELPILFSNNIYLKKLESYKNLPPITATRSYDQFLPNFNFKGKGLVFKLTNKLFPDDNNNQIVENKELAIKKIKEGNFDIFHPTYYDDYFLEFIGDKPFVLTVYDCIHQIFPEYGLYECNDKNKKLLDKASHIIAISNSTKSDLINFFNIDEKKISVTWLGNSLIKKTDTVTAVFKEKLPFKYFLFVGGRGLYKNFMFFIQMFSVLAHENNDINVVCTGSPFTDDEMYLFKKIGILSRVHHTFVSDEELAYLYKNALAFIFPSMYEGFGIPVLEAFSCGCPVLVSNTSSLIEIGGGAVIYFEPKSPSTMLKAMRSILLKPHLRKELIKKGYNQLNLFSWQETANQTIQIYNKVLNDNSIN